MSAQDAVNEGSRPGALDHVSLDVLISGDSRRFEDIDQDTWWEPFKEEGHGGGVSGDIQGVVCQLFELGDVLIDFSWFHNQFLKFDLSTIGPLRVLELSFEFQQEGVPYGGDVLSVRVKCFNLISHIASPSSDLWSFNEGEGE
jgi:hypothetical protein